MNFLNLRLAKTFTTLQGQNVELTADLFNTFSLLDAAGIRNDWGRVKQVSGFEDRKSTRLNSSHLVISYAVFCLKKKKYHRIFILARTQIILSTISINDLRRR